MRTGRTSFSVKYFVPLFFVLMLVPVALFYPGVLDFDSVDLMLESRQGYHTWHSHVLAFLWGLLQRIWVGPPLLFLSVQLTFFCALFFLLLRLVPDATYRQLTAIVVTLHPFSLAFLGYLCKDSICAAALTVSAAGLIWINDARRRIRNAAIVFTFLPLVVSGCVRIDSALVGTPIAFSGFWILFSQSLPTATKLRRALLASASAILVGVFSLIVFWSSAILINAERRYPIQVPLAFDLAGVFVSTGQIEMPDWLTKKGTTPEKLRELYSPVDSNPIFWPGHTTGVPLTTSQADIRQSIMSWIGTVSAHPAAYLKHRITFASYLLGIQRQPHYLLINWETVHPTMLANPDEYNARFIKNAALKCTETVLYYLYETPFGRPWFYVIILIAAATAACLKNVPHQFWIVAIAASGLVQVLVMSLAAAVASLRYLFWAILATQFVVVPFILNFFTNRGSDQPTTK